MQEITDRLFEMQDLKYKEFHQRLIPNIDPDTVIGVRMPALRIYAKELVKEVLKAEGENEVKKIILKG